MLLVLGSCVVILKFVFMVIGLGLFRVRCVWENCIFLCGSILLKCIWLFKVVLIVEVFKLFLLLMDKGNGLFFEVLKGVGIKLWVVVKLVFNCVW